ncbi:3016_t:CDS:1 [Dentiscutata heterogama]|uniref:3016_t:CDS:1 n=1 Tax=Dentiscutata heterogama TaxID=1316150 RepID=A0ACA9K4W8_9GLOM|nr:3016_t:CDS:1 [Dentiscutata heterogama]
MLMKHLPGYGYTMMLSGKDQGKEKYLYLYRKDKWTLRREYIFDVDITRPPYVVTFERKGRQLRGGKIVILDSITLIGYHTKPSNAYNETIRLLEQVYPKVLNDSGKNPVIILDDLNASFTTRWVPGFINKLSELRLICGIGDKQDTTVIPSGVKNRFKSYDRIIYQESNSHKIKDCKVYKFND